MRRADPNQWLFSTQAIGVLEAAARPSACAVGARLDVYGSWAGAAPKWYAAKVVGVEDGGKVRVASEAGVDVDGKMDPKMGDVERDFRGHDVRRSSKQRRALGLKERAEKTSF